MHQMTERCLCPKQCVDESANARLVSFAKRDRLYVEQVLGTLLAQPAGAKRVPALTYVKNARMWFVRR
jgi:hypothetical protein